MNGIKRENKVYLRVPVESKISEAGNMIECLGNDERLTEALNLLIKASELVSEYVNEEIKKSIK